MRILCISEYYNFLGGAEQYLHNIINGLEHDGHVVGIIHAGAKFEQVSMSIRFTKTSDLLSLERMDFNRKNFSELEQLVSSFHPDVLYVHQVHSFALLKSLADRWPIVKFVHDYRFVCPAGPAFLPIGKACCSGPCGLFRCVLSAGLRLCCGVRWPHRLIREIYAHRYGLNLIHGIRLIVASEYMRNIIVRNGFLASRVHVIPYFCNFEDAMPGVFRNYVLFCGRLHNMKGLSLLISSMKMWPKELDLVVLGDGPDRSKCEALVEKHRLKNRVRFLGYVDNLDAQIWFNNCLALAVTSIWGEPFGIVGLEAMCHAKPVVAFNVGGIAEWLDNGKTGILVQAGDVNGLAEAIRKVHEDRAWAESLGAAGRERYFSFFTRERHQRRLVEVLKLAQRGSC